MLVTAGKQCPLRVKCNLLKYNTSLGSTETLRVKYSEQDDTGRLSHRYSSAASLHAQSRRKLSRPAPALATIKAEKCGGAIGDSPTLFRVPFLLDTSSASSSTRFMYSSNPCAQTKHTQAGEFSFGFRKCL